MKRMLFNTMQAEELRVAIVDGQELIDLELEHSSKSQKKGNIYKAIITRVEASLEAVFVDYGAERHGFLPIKEISRSALPSTVANATGRVSELLKEGMELLVQVEKDERGSKGAALTTYISLAGRYIVLMPTNSRGGGISRRIEGNERNELREVLDQLSCPQGMSVIARTAAIGRTLAEIEWDLNYLAHLWTAISSAAETNHAPLLIYQESALIIRAIRDYFQADIGEIIIDTEEVYNQAKAFMEQVIPENADRVKRYQEDIPLFSRFQIENQIETAYARQVNLPSGGAIIIDYTEALIAIDVNSARATRGADIEETALKTNLEAANEIARQLRLRDLGGLVVIDFIDMESAKARNAVENNLRQALKPDRARVQIGRVSRFGLLELSRQRLSSAIDETSYGVCPRCTGTGYIRSIESNALQVLRIIQEEALKENTAGVRALLPVEVASYLINEKRNEIMEIERRTEVAVMLVPTPNIQNPMHTIARLRNDELHNELSQPSYNQIELHADEAQTKSQKSAQQKVKNEEPAVKAVTPKHSPPPTKNKKVSAETNHSLLDWFSKLLSGTSKLLNKPQPAEASKAPPPTTAKTNPPRRRSRRASSTSSNEPRPEQKKISTPKTNDEVESPRKKNTSATEDSSEQQSKTTQPRTRRRNRYLTTEKRQEPQTTNRTEEKASPITENTTKKPATNKTPANKKTQPSSNNNQSSSMAPPRTTNGNGKPSSTRVTEDNDSGSAPTIAPKKPEHTTESATQRKQVQPTTTTRSEQSDQADNTSTSTVTRVADKKPAPANEKQTPSQRLKTSPSTLIMVETRPEAKNTDTALDPSKQNLSAETSQSPAAWQLQQSAETKTPTKHEPLIQVETQKKEAKSAETDVIER